MSDLEAPVVLVPFVVLSQADFVAATGLPAEHYSPAIAQATKMPAVAAVKEMYRRVAERGLSSPDFAMMLTITRQIMLERYQHYDGVNIATPPSGVPS